MPRLRRFNDLAVHVTPASSPPSHQLPHWPPRDSRSAVVCGSGSGYRRSDGISVVPVGALGP